jgi:hypothetical protein
MDELIRGTTPTYIFQDFGFEVSEITAGYFVITQAKKVIIEKDLSAATIADGAVRWTLTQAESLSLDASKPATVYMIWKNGAVRGETERLTVEVRDTAKDEEI